MFARKKPALPVETSTPTPAPTDALSEVAAPPPPEPAAPVETSTLTPAPAEVVEEAPTPPPGPAPAAASPAPSARPVAPAAARPKTASVFHGDLAFTGTLSGAGDVHLGGAFQGDLRVRDVTVGATGRVEGTITGRRIEVLGRVRGGLVADEVRVRGAAQVDGDVTSESFTLEAGARFEGHSKRKSR